MTGSGRQRPDEVPPEHADSGSCDIRPERVRIESLLAAVLGAAARHGFPESTRFAVRLALEEALQNAFHHGHRALPPQTPARVDYAVTPDELTLTVTDEGPGFDPSLLPDPTLDENIEKPSGRGVMLMRAYMTEVAFSPKGNSVVMRLRKR